MSRFRYQMVAMGADHLVETLNALGQAGWRLVTATPTGDVWSALLEKGLDGHPQPTAAPPARVEVRIGDNRDRSRGRRSVGGGQHRVPASRR
jgi:hypothetical protein